MIPHVGLPSWRDLMVILTFCACLTPRLPNLSSINLDSTNLGSTNLSCKPMHARRCQGNQALRESLDVGQLGVKGA
jgi:hypothetical protein